MTANEATEKEARRAAYAAYVACFWSLRRLPLTDAHRPALAQATQRAESVWRALMARTMGDTPPDGSATSATPRSASGRGSAPRRVATRP